MSTGFTKQLTTACPLRFARGCCANADLASEVQSTGRLGPNADVQSSGRPGDSGIGNPGKKIINLRKILRSTFIVY